MVGFELGRLQAGDGKHPLFREVAGLTRPSRLLEFSETAPDDGLAEAEAEAADPRPGIAHRL